MGSANVRTDWTTIDTSFCLGLGGQVTLTVSYSYSQAAWRGNRLCSHRGMHFHEWAGGASWSVQSRVHPSSLLQIELWSSHWNFSLWKHEATMSTFLRSTQYQIKSWKLEETKIECLRLLERTSLMVQWLRLHIPYAGSLGSIPGLGTRSYMLQLRSSAAK